MAVHSIHYNVSLVFNAKLAFFIGLVCLFSCKLIAQTQPLLQPSQSPANMATVRLAPELIEQADLTTQSEHAEILYSYHQTKILDNLHWQQIHYYSIRILDEAAAQDYAQLSFDFFSQDSQLTINFANVLRPDKSQYSLLRPSTAATTEFQTGLLVTSRIRDLDTPAKLINQGLVDTRTQLSFTPLEVGSIIEIQYTLESTRIIPESAFAGHFSQTNSPYFPQLMASRSQFRADSVQFYQFELSYPDTMRLFNKRFAGYPSTNQLVDLNHSSNDKTSAATITKKWEMKRLPMLAFTSNSANSQQLIPQIQLSSLTSWDEVVEWVNLKSQPDEESNIDQKRAQLDKLNNIINSLSLADDADDTAKIKAVYQFIKHNIAYQFEPFDTHFNRDVNAILNQGHANANEQTIVVVALLNALGVAAYPAWIETHYHGYSDGQIVRPIFDHALVFLPNQVQKWLDTTNESVIYPGVPAEWVGNNALILNQHSAQFTRVKADELIKNQAELNLFYSHNAKGRLQLDLTITLSGFFEQAFRRATEQPNMGLSRAFSPQYNQSNRNYSVESATQVVQSGSSQNMENVSLDENNAHSSTAEQDLLSRSAGQSEDVSSQVTEVKIEDAQMVSKPNMTTSADNIIEYKLDSLFSDKANFALTYQINNVDSLFMPLSISAQYDFMDTANQRVMGASVAQLFNLFTGMNELPPSENLSLGYVDPSGYQINLKAYFKGDKTTIPSLYQASGNLISPYFHLIQQGSAVQDDYQLMIQFTQNELSLNQKEYQDYLIQVQRLSNLEPWLIAMRDNPAFLAQQKIFQTEEEFGLHSREVALAKIQNALNQGKFEQAVQFAQSAVKSYPQDGQLWYLLACALGFNQQSLQATDAFEKAKMLGYSFQDWLSD